MNKLWLELQVHHLGWKMLMVGVVECNTSIDAASHQEISIWRVSNSLDWLVELSEGEVVSNTSLFNVEDSHCTRCKSTGKNGKLRMGTNAKSLIDWTGVFHDLIEVVQVPKSDG